MAISRDAFTIQVRLLVPRLLAVARRLAQCDADAEDLVADAVERAWRGIDGLDDEGAFRAWLFRILHNTFVSEYRHARARPRFEPLDEDEDGCESIPFSVFEQMHQPFLLWFSNPEQEFLDKLLREDLEKALAALPDHHRIVVLLADVEEFGYAEIAQTLAIPVGTVRSRLARARSVLQKRLWQQAQAYGLHGAAGAPVIEHTADGSP